MKYIGDHVSISKGIENAPLNAHQIGAKAFAIFTKNQRQWKSNPLTKKSIELFNSRCEEFGFKKEYILPHDSYLINLGSPDEEKLQKSISSFIDELNRCDELGLYKLNFHPGSHLRKISKKDKNYDLKLKYAQEECLSVIVKSINTALDKSKNVVAVIENTAGQGSNLGYKFEHLSYIIDGVKDKDRIGVCIDTCHLFASGYDIRDKQSYEKTMQEFDRVVGFRYLKGMHLNDSKGELNSRLDRHESIGKGKIGLDGFRLLMNDKRLDNIPLILETIDSSIWSEEIKLLYSLID